MDRPPGASPRDNMSPTVSPRLRASKRPASPRMQQTCPQCQKNPVVGAMFDPKTKMTMRLCAQCTVERLDYEEVDEEESNSEDATEGVPLKINFPPNYPIQSKIVRLRLDKTVAENVHKITKQFAFLAPNDSDIVLAACAMKEPRSSTKHVDVAEFMRTAGYPVLDSDALLGDYSKILPFFESFDYKSADDVVAPDEQPDTAVVSRPEDVKHAVHLKRQTINFAELISEGDPVKIYKNFTHIGKGGYSNVWTAIDSRTNEKVAVKVVKIREKNFKYVIQEMANHKTSSHPNVVEFKESFYVPTEGRLWMVLEHMGGGSLTSRLPVKDEVDIAFVSRETLKALAFIHSKNRIHRDVKSDNILITSDGKMVKIADFGFATKWSESDAQRRMTCVGTAHWLAPEMIRGRPYSFGVDLWSLGITVIEMAEGEPPYWNDNRSKTFNLITTQGAYLAHPERRSRDLVDFVAECCMFDPQQRPTAQQLLQHPFLTAAKKFRGFRVSRKSRRDTDA